MRGEIWTHHLRVFCSSFFQEAAQKERSSESGCNEVGGGGWGWEVMLRHWPLRARLLFCAVCAWMLAGKKVTLIFGLKNKTKTISLCLSV